MTRSLRESGFDGAPSRGQMFNRWLTFKMKQSARLEARIWELVDWPEQRSVVERKLERLRRL